MTQAERISIAKRHYELALAAHRQDRLTEAAQHYRDVQALFPNHPGASHGLGLVALREYQYDEAATQLRAASSAAPDNSAIRTDLGQALLRSGHYEDALRTFRAALRLQPENIAALNGAGDTLNILGRPEEAKTAFRKALTLNPNNSSAYFGIASALNQLGDSDGAKSQLTEAISLAPKNATYHRALAEIDRFFENDARLSALEELAREEQKLPDSQKVELHFALAKAYEDLKRYDGAFAHLQKGNSLRRSMISYDEDAIAVSFAALKKAFPGKPPRDIEAEASLAPIFIVGMPRSGSTLVEQILSRDPSVFGAGELTYIQDLLSETFGGFDYPHDIATLAGRDVSRFGKEYLRKLGKLPPGVRHVIDKFPGNFQHIGLIHLALPDAKIVHIRRDPMDACLSCYSKLFLNGLNYTYDLGELGRYYRMYESLMTHWQSVLPASALIEIQYETLVEDFEKQTRRLVAFCELDWNENFLSFHENKRAVRTHSQSQVRQPLYKSAVGRWQHYESHLLPLREALGQSV